MENSEKILLEIFNKRMNYENERIDFKEIFTFDDTRDRLEIIKDIVSFANTNGGYIVYGVNNKFEWVGLDERSTEINDIQIIDYARKFISDLFEIKCGKYELDDNLFYLITIEKKIGELISFIQDGKYKKKKLNGKEVEDYIFRKNDIYGRVGSSSKPVNNDKLFLKRKHFDYGIVTNLDKIEQPYINYVDRPDDTNRLLEKLCNLNINNVQINGLGGIGKTSFIYEFCKNILSKKVRLNKDIKFIVWITGKLTIFMPSGEIKTIRPKEISLSEVLEVFTNVFEISYDENQEHIINNIYDIMSLYPTLVVFDNMETITDENIINFLLKFPMNTHVIFTTRENIKDLQYARIDLDGFDREHFIEYFKYQIQLFDYKKCIDLKNVEPYYNRFYSLIQGSPIMTNMIAFKIGESCDIHYLISQLSSRRTKDKTYDNAMAFCFEEVFESLDNLDRKILFILSIPDSNEENFSIQDIMLCTGEDEHIIVEKMQKLYRLSFCNVNNSNYSSPNLVKVFTNKKISEGKYFDLTELKDKYTELLKEKEKLGKLSNNIYLNAKACTYAEKSATYILKSVLEDFEITKDIDDTIKKMDKLINENPNFAYLYFRRALFEKEIDSNSSIVKSYFDKALELDADNDHIWTEYAFYIEKISRLTAVDYFEMAIKLNDSNRSAHHGLAVCLVKLYNNKPDFELQKDRIIGEFNKGYSEKENFYWNKHNSRNAHSHASYLKNIKMYEEALSVCQRALEKYPRESKLITLEGNIKLAIDPNYIHPERINAAKKGIFANASDDILKELIKSTGFRKTKK